MKLFLKLITMVTINFNYRKLLSASRGSMLAIQKDYDTIDKILKKSESFFSDKYQILWDHNTNNIANDQVLRRLYLVNQISNFWRRN